MTYIAHEVISGVYEKTVKMTVDRRLQYAPYAHAGWRNRKTVGGDEAVLVCGKWILHSTGEVVA